MGWDLVGKRGRVRLAWGNKPFRSMKLTRRMVIGATMDVL